MVAMNDNILQLVSVVIAVIIILFVLLLVAGVVFCTLIMIQRRRDEKLYKELEDESEHYNRH